MHNERLQDCAKGIVMQRLQVAQASYKRSLSRQLSNSL
jgi:hypothetical protein